MNTPTEYFGPHAKRWTHPRTGVTYSVKPRDYHQLVAEQEEIREEELRRLGQLKSRTVSEEAVAAITAREERLRDEAVSAAWDDKALDAEYPEMIDRNQAETKRILAKVNDDLSTFNTLYGGKITSETLYDPVPMPEPIRGIRLRFLSRVEDDMFSVVRPAARHLKSRKITRNAVRLGLVYIIAIIGVMAVTGVIS